MLIYKDKKAPSGHKNNAGRALSRENKAPAEKKGDFYEEDLPAQKETEEQSTRIQKAYGFQRGKKGS